MNNKGFTLIEFLICLAMFGFVLVMGICASKNKLAASLAVFRPVSNNEVFKAAKDYFISQNISFDGKSYVCVDIRDLIEYGYLEDTNDQTLKEKIVKLKKNSITNLISNFEYTSNCD